MSIIFPPFPSQNQTFTSGSRTWKWNGYAWDAVFVFPEPETGGLSSVGVSGGITINDVETLTFESITDVVKVYGNEFDANDALISIGITDESGTNYTDRDLDRAHFYPIQPEDRQGIGRKVLVLNDDGSVGFEYIKFQDVFKNSEFQFTVSNFTLNGKSSHKTLIGLSTNRYALSNLPGSDSFNVTYPSLSVSPVSAQISSPSFFDTQTFSLPAPDFDTLSVFDDQFQVFYPSSSNGKVTFTLTAVGDNGQTVEDDCEIRFPNYLYYGVGASAGVTGGNLNQQSFSQYLIESSDFTVSNGGFEVQFDCPSGDDFLWFAYPSKFGRLSFVRNVIANQDVSDEFPTRPTESHENILEYVEDYYIYRISQGGRGSLTYSFFIE